MVFEVSKPGRGASGIYVTTVTKKLKMFSVVTLVMDQLMIARELWRSGERNFKDGMFIAATVDYSKSTFAVVDYIIIKKVGIKPDNHNKRFDIVFYRFKNIYSSLKVVYDLYRDAYSRIISETETKEVKKNAEKIFKEIGVFEQLVE